MTDRPSSRRQEEQQIRGGAQTRLVLDVEVEGGVGGVLRVGPGLQLRFNCLRSTCVSRDDSLELSWVSTRATKLLFKLLLTPSRSTTTFEERHKWKMWIA